MITDPIALERRNNDLVEKFNELYEIQRMRYEDVLYELKWEYFFLSERSIKEIIRSSGVKLPYTSVIKVESKAGLTNVLEARNIKMIAYFNELSNVERLRTDDAIHQTAFKFYLKASSVERILLNN